MDPHNTEINNNLHTKEECPDCHFVFIAGYNENGIRKCPSCYKQFRSGKKTECSNRNNGANNVYYKDGCPAIMSDGRFITNYNSTNELTETMRKANGIKSPNQFRTFMQNNANQFMDAERNFVTKQNTCSPTTACSEGWYNLWTQNQGNWANINQANANTNQTPQPFNA